MHPSMSSVLDTSFPDMPNPILLHAAACEFSKAKVNRSGGQEFRANLTVTCFDGKRFTRYYAARGNIVGKQVSNGSGCCYYLSPELCHGLFKVNFNCLQHLK